MQPRPRFRAYLVSLLVIVIAGACGTGHRARLAKATGTELTSCPSYPFDTSKLPGDLPPASTVEVGAVPAEFQVDDSGQARYTIPIATPPGRLGIEPQLSIDYASDRGDGPLGYRFALLGLSSINRCPKNIGDDNESREVRYDGDDRFCLDGQRLVQVPLPDSGPILVNQAEFRTDPDTFVRVRAYFDGDIENPARFRVWGKGGHILDYGVTPDSQARASNGVVRSWSLSRVADRSGNFLSVQYEKVAAPDGSYTAEQRPIEIDYTGLLASPGDDPPFQFDPGEGVSMPPTRSIVFTYEPREGRPVVAYSGGMRLTLTKRLARIDAFVQGQGLTRSYRLHYDVSSPALRDRIRSVEECTSFVCKRPTTFKWANNSSFDPTVHPNPADPAFVFFPTPQARELARYEKVFITGTGPSGPFVGDVTGDGVPEVVVEHHEFPPDGSAPSSTWTIFDVTGSSDPVTVDRVVDQGPVPGNPGQTAFNTAQGFLVDWDGDGRDDFLRWDPNFDTNWSLYRADGTALPAVPTVSPVPKLLGQPDSNSFLGDFDADGRIDLVQCGPGADGQIAWQAWLDAAHQATPSTIAPLAGTPCTGDNSVIPLHASGRSATDLLVRESGMTPAYELVSFRGSTWEGRPFSAPIDPKFVVYRVADINGDGLDDLLVGTTDSQIGFAINTGAGFTAVQLLDFAVSPSQLARAVLTDVNGDSFADVLVRTSSPNTTAGDSPS